MPILRQQRRSMGCFTYSSARSSGHHLAAVDRDRRRDGDDDVSHCVLPRRGRSARHVHRTLRRPGPPHRADLARRDGAYWGHAGVRAEPPPILPRRDGPPGRRVHLQRPLRSATARPPTSSSPRQRSAASASSASPSTASTTSTSAGAGARVSARRSTKRGSSFRRSSSTTTASRTSSSSRFCGATCVSRSREPHRLRLHEAKHALQAVSPILVLAA